MHAILSAQGAPKFRKFCNSFAGFSQSICAIMTPRACFFRSARTVDPSESLSENIWVAQLMLAENNDFCAHGAPKFRKFCNSFAKFLRNFYMISTSDAHFFRYKQDFDFTESCSDVTRFSKAKAGRVHEILFAQGAPKFYKICNSFARFSHNICVILTPRACFSGLDAWWTRSRA